MRATSLEIWLRANLRAQGRALLRLHLPVAGGFASNLRRKRGLRLHLPVAGGAVLIAAVLGGCSSDGGGGEVLHVSKDDRAKQQYGVEKQTVDWLEKMPADQRQAAVNRAGKIKQVLKDASGTDLKPRVEALGVQY